MYVATVSKCPDFGVSVWPGSSLAVSWLRTGGSWQGHSTAELSLLTWGRGEV